MIAASHMKGLTVAIFGLGRSGLAAARACLDGGATVMAWDDHASGRDAASDKNIPIVDLRDVDFSDIDRLVLSPGVPLTHPEPHWTVEKAHAAGVPIIGDTEIFIEAIALMEPKPGLIAITGTNGKSTTTALVGHIASQNMPTQIGGNIGVPVLELEPFESGGVYVIEFSSYQIDLTPSLKPDIAMCLNLSPDHLDRHGTMENYAHVKAKIFAQQDAGDCAIVGDDDDYCTGLALNITRPKRVTVSGYHQTKGVSVVKDRLFEGTQEIANLGVLKNLLGNHNAQNIAASFAAAKQLGIKDADIISSIKTFSGLAHRMEYLGSVGGVDIINDSKATNVDAASMALSCLDNVHWIVGGLAKEGGIDPLLEFASHIRRAYIIGSSMDVFSATLEGKVPYSQCGTMEEAVRLAAENAQSEAAHSVILLSPAAASFDQYRNFELRGEDFRSHVASLDGFKAQEKAGT